MAGGVFSERFGANGGILYISNRGILKRGAIYAGNVNVYRRFSGINGRRYQDKHIFCFAYVGEKPYDKKALWGISQEYTGGRDFQGLYDCVSFPDGGVRRHVPALRSGTGIYVYSTDV